MNRTRVIAMTVVTALAIGSGIAFANPAGPARVAAEPILVHMVGNTITLQPGQEAKVLSRQCPAGEMAISGAVGSGADPGTFTMTTSTPWWDHGPRGWVGGGRNSGSQPIDMYVYAYCTAATIPNTPVLGLPSGQAGRE